MFHGGRAGLRCYEDDVNSYQHSTGPCAIALGSTEPEPLEQPALFPNPGTDRLIITTDPTLAPNSTVQLVDAQGRVIATTTLATARSGWHLGEVVPGCFVVRILDGTHRLHTIKWIRT